MRVFGVVVFVLGALALGILIVRRGRNLPVRWGDHLMLFLGIAGTITGLAIVFTLFD